MNLYDIFSTYILPNFIDFEMIPTEATTTIKFLLAVGLFYIAFWLIIWLPFKLFRKLIGVKK